MFHFKHTILLNFGQLRIIASCKYMTLEINMHSKTINFLLCSDFAHLTNLPVLTKKLGWVSESCQHLGTRYNHQQQGGPLRPGSHGAIILLLHFSTEA